MSMWNSWETVNLALDEIVLVKFEFSDGKIHIEDALIIKNDVTGEFTYCLFDGESYNITVTPIEWMRIPK